MPGAVNTIPICEIFRSLQGETTLAGRPAVFLRVAGCNLRCRYCDTTYAYGPGTPYSVAALLEAVDAHPAGDLVVVTGGEPLSAPLVPALCQALADRGRTVLLETNGSLDLSGLDPRVRRILDVKCPGSGEAEANRWSNLALLTASDEVKLVLTDRADFDFAREVAARHRLLERCPVLLSPAAGVLDPAELAAWILASGQPFRLQLQLHRVLWPGRDRGV